MAGSDGNTKVVLLALGANLGIAIAKLVAALVTGSAAMLAESVHSFADSGNQLLLLLGGRRAARPRDGDHPLGYGREAYFWALIVAVVLFTLGGVYSLVEGVHKLKDPHPINSPGWAIGVLVVGLVLEGTSLFVAWRMGQHVRRGAPLLTWARDTGNVNLLVVLFEDLAAMMGLVLALLAVGGAVLFDLPILDGVGTCAIGLLLIVVAVFLANQIRRLVVGFRACQSLHDGVEVLWQEAGFDVLDLVTTWSGVDEVMVIAKVRPHDMHMTAEALIARINATEQLVAERYPRVRQLFVEPDFTAGVGVRP